MGERKACATQNEMVLQSVVALVLILVACVDLCDAATVVDVYRLIQYDMSGIPLGSRLASLNHHAASLHFPPGADLSRTVLIIPLRDLNITFIKDYISEKQPLGGLLFLLPQILSFGNGDGRGEENQIQGKEQMKDLLAELEQLLVHVKITYPVYFAFENEELDAVLSDVQKNDAIGQPATATTGGYKLVVSAPEPRKVASPTITNIQVSLEPKKVWRGGMPMSKWILWKVNRLDASLIANETVDACIKKGDETWEGWLPGLKADGDSNQLPTIAIVASYDTFGAAPALSVGSESNGSGVVALLELARLFSLLYSNPKTRGSYNLLFGLTSGGPYNYNGTHKWLRSFDQRLRESIDYAICLNSIGSWDNELWIHVSKPPENAYIKQIFEGFSNVAKELGFQMGLKHKKINISNPRVAWEHEQFSRMRVTAATLSALSTPPELLERTGGLSDSRHFVNDTAIIRSVQLVAESLARHIYGHKGKGIQIFSDDSSLAVNPSYIRSWVDLLSRTPRVAPFLAKNDPFIAALKKELADHTGEVNMQHDVFDGMFAFYDSTKASLNIYQVASVTFDLLLLLVLGSYLIMLFSFLVITTRGLDDLISIFRRPPSRKVKIA